ncbi:hypothetical protein BMS3Abin05_01671 [bacterium BMS3Abin05]|nr:hypothetical protein BMS3Abin05_01671 [bacterium BMS3Abin05]GBE28020.1 hypothetical protein BMS3Bbin03_01956 [bacterium BMS3Bbin03]HDK36135.1 hypothetical protein [Bacteroidota bacterium]HDL78182.1 hypothetical protein [Bacteroidota bacterium]HDZ12953.1 hypothetical protein [Bacteroidota bacterium]
MKPAARWLFLFGFVSLFVACRRGPKEVLLPPVPAGAFQYAGYDSTGVVIVQGWLSLSFEDSTAITGKWQLQKVGEATHIGPQTGTGTLAGSIRLGKIFLNLNPQIVDNNVAITGDFAKNRFSGKWQYIGFAGLLNWGPFTAEKRTGD